MKRPKYPQYRMTQWLDNSDESMQREQATILYGVQTLRHKGGQWAHVCGSNEPLLFDTREEASTAVEKMSNLVDAVAEVGSTCYRELDAARSNIERLRAENAALRSAVDFAAGAIGEAIYTEDGLDGDAGQRVLHLLTEAREKGTFDVEKYGDLDNLCPFIRSEKAEAENAALRDDNHVLRMRADDAENALGCAKADAESWRAIAERNDPVMFRAAAEDDEERARLRTENAALRERQAWLDDVRPPNHPDDERHWVGAYLAWRKRAEKAEAENAALRRLITSAMKDAA